MYVYMNNTLSHTHHLTHMHTRTTARRLAAVVRPAHRQVVAAAAPHLRPPPHRLRQASAAADHRHQ